MAGVILNGWSVDETYAQQLRDWLAANEAEFTPEELPRARAAVSYLEREARRIRPRQPIAGIRALIPTVLIVAVMIPVALAIPLALVARLRGAAAETLSTGAFTVIAPVTVVVVCVGLVSARMPGWVRTLSAIISALILLFLLIGIPLIMSGLNADARLAVFCLFGGVVVWILALALGGRR